MLNAQLKVCRRQTSSVFFRRVRDIRYCQCPLLQLSVRRNFIYM